MTQEKPVPQSVPGTSELTMGTESVCRPALSKPDADARDHYKDTLFSAQTSNALADDILVETQNLSFPITTFGGVQTTHQILVDADRLSDPLGLLNPLRHF